MPVRTTTSCPAPATGDGSAPGAGSGPDARLPWWGLALPVLAFVALLLLVADPAAGAAPGGGELLTRLAEMAGR
ncbi:hypothetical protein [Streptomyces sp. UH6]|uniref:hypothetical protein n=1 Tax=Streptomyces sp. UH6 TaxID=2748379 RepID=UPI0015D4A386|nr:hypothetical protein [Streptomyces sp. UH6]NYV76921.1 hypothetical protein [Streptomyces sp. UH6]